VHRPSAKTHLFSICVPGGARARGICWQYREKRNCCFSFDFGTQHIVNESMTFAAALYKLPSRPRQLITILHIRNIICRGGELRVSSHFWKVDKAGSLTNPALWVRWSTLAVQILFWMIKHQKFTTLSYSSIMNFSVYIVTRKNTRALQRF
jgi:hypothetical protein